MVHLLHRLYGVDAPVIRDSVFGEHKPKNSIDTLPRGTGGVSTFLNAVSSINN